MQAIDSAVTPPPVAERSRVLDFRFTGNTSEYFRIWIVNTLLSIVTLGVYSAWAKVRDRQYFYRHTWVDGTSFEYLADPIAILKGRLIMAAAFGILFGSQYYSPMLYLALVGVMVLATPWIVVKALAFNARSSAYRNVRFAFTGKPADAFGLYLGMMLLQIFTCGLAYPYVQWRLTRFVVGHHYYGDTLITWRTRAGEYYRAYLGALALAAPAYAGLVAVVMAMRPEPGEDPKTMFAGPLSVVLVLLYAYFLVPAAFLRARLANLIYGGMAIGEHNLASTQRAGDLVKIYVTNALAIVFSLGLLIPWARIRLARYRSEHLTLHAFGSLDTEALDLPSGRSAVGDAAHDLGDFDLGIGA
jgi:uncharacterized membrane protein YjgN (DUF898 family)